MPHRQRIAHVQLDERTMVRRRPEVEHERAIAIYDLIEENYFAPHGDYAGPYNLHLSLEDNRLVFDIRDEAGGPLVTVGLPLKQFQSIVKDYFMVCESYYTAIKKSSPSQIEAIDIDRSAGQRRQKFQVLFVQMLRGPDRRRLGPRAPT